MSQVLRLWFQVLWTSGCHLARGVKSLVFGNTTLAEAYGRHYGRIAITRLRAFDTSRPPITANRAPVEPVPCSSDSHHSRAAPPRRPSPPTPRARAPPGRAVPPPPPCELATFRSRRHLRRANRRAERERPRCQQRSCCWPNIASIDRLPTTRAIVQPPTVALPLPLPLPLTPTGPKIFSTHPRRP